MLDIYLGRTLSFKVADVPVGIARKIKRKFRTEHPDYFKMRKRSKTEDVDVQKYLNLYEKIDDRLAIPRGCASYLTDILKEHNIEYRIIDERLLLDKVDIPDMKWELRKYQQKASNKAVLITQGVIEAPCGSGKTVMGVDIISKVKQPSLVIVPDTELMRQWTERLSEALGMDDDDIGIVGDGYYHIGLVTIATNQSLYNLVDDEDFCNQFGLVLMDESHMVGARTFREVMNAFPARYRYGLTATPFRNDNLTDLIENYCGKKFYTITDDDLEKEGLLIKPEVLVRKTKFYIHYNFKDPQMNNKMLKAMSESKVRNKQICKDIIAEYKDNRLCLVVAKRAEHCSILKEMLEEMDSDIVVGDISGNSYDETVVQRARDGEVDVVLSVNRAVQGLDIQNLESLFIIAPRKARGEIVQIIGRVQRPSKCHGKYKNPTDKIARIFDYEDEKMESGVIGAFNARMEIYEEKGFI